jgi:hypothetical protein
VAVFEIGGGFLIGIRRPWNPHVKSPCGSRVGEGSARTGPPDRMLGEYHGQPNSVRGCCRRTGAVSALRALVGCCLAFLPGLPLRRTALHNGAAELGGTR